MKWYVLLLMVASLGCASVQAQPPTQYAEPIVETDIAPEINDIGVYSKSDSEGEQGVLVMAITKGLVDRATNDFVRPKHAHDVDVVMWDAQGRKWRALWKLDK